MHDYLGLWNWDGVQRRDRIHHALYLKCREKAAREASPTACIIDSQSVKSAEKGRARIDSHGFDVGKVDQGQEAACSSGRYAKACCCTASSPPPTFRIATVRSRRRCWRPCLALFPTFLWSRNCSPTKAPIRARVFHRALAGILPDLETRDASCEPSDPIG